MPASVRNYDQILKTLDLERYVSMYQRKPASRKSPLLPEPLAGMLVAIDGRITNAKPQEGGDDTHNPQRLWCFVVDDGSGGVALVARKAQVLPLLTCMEASAPVYIVGRLRFVHEIGDNSMVSTLIGWPRQPDDLVCEVLRAGASEGMDVRADDTPEAHDEDREKQRRDDDAMAAGASYVGVPSSAAKLREQLKATAIVGSSTAVLGDIPRSMPPPAQRAETSLRILGGPSLAEVADGYAGRPYTVIAAAVKGIDDLLADAQAAGLNAAVRINLLDGQGEVASVALAGPGVHSGELLADEARRWLTGFMAARAATR